MQKIRRFIVAALLASFLCGPCLGDAEKDLSALIEKVQQKIGENKREKADYAEDFEAFDALLEKYKDDKSEEVARILLMKAMLSIQILQDTDTGMAELKKLVVQFPESESAQMAKSVFQEYEMKAKLAVGAEFPDFEEKDTDGEPLSIGKFKGKVVLVDFWATWCGPCVQELPHVLDAYKTYADKGFEIVGISLDKDQSALTKFTKRQKMTWPQYYDGKGWENKLAQYYGIRSIPATFLIDQDGKIAAKDLRGDALSKAIAGLLEK